MADTIPRRPAKGRRGRPKPVKLIPVAPFREAFQQQSYRTVEMIAEEMRWFKWERKGKSVPDVTRVKRTLGISPKMRAGGLVFMETIEEEVAIALLRAMDLDPVDIGV